MIQWPQLRALGNTDFDVEKDEFSKLDIRPASKDGKFHYFYHAGQARLITDFIIENKPQVATMCTVILIRKDEGYSPRLRFWKKDKTQAGKQAMSIQIPNEDVTREIKASVNTGEAYGNFWKLIDFLQSFKDVELPANEFRIVSASSAQLVEQLRGSDRRTVLEAVSTFLEGSLTQADIHLIANRKGQLDYFGCLLHDADFFEQERARLNKDGKEALWQYFFEQNAWIFGYGLNLIACESFDDKKLERITTGNSLFQGAGKRSDAVMRSRSAVSSLVFCEIKTHEKPLLEKAPYRPPDVYQVSAELTGAVSQVQKTADKALRGMKDYVERHYEPDGTPTGIEFSTVRPRGVVVIGNLEQLSSSGAVNPEQLSSFEFYRKAIADVEIITFDELYQRARFIVEDV
jgi:hypothetical protein